MRVSHNLFPAILIGALSRERRGEVISEEALRDIVVEPRLREPKRRSFSGATDFTVSTKARGVPLWKRQRLARRAERRGRK